MLFFNKPGKHVDEAWIEKSKTFCMLPWLHLHVTQTGNVAPCCQTPWDESTAYGNVNKQSIEEIWNGEVVRKMRLQMLKDKPDARCERCYLKEMSGVFSLRKGTNLMYKHHLNRINKTERNGTIENSPPVYFDIRFSNLCNFKCRICGPDSSSAWYDDAKKMGYQVGSNRITYSIKDEPAFFESIKKYLPQVEEIYFAGGEPILMDQHYKLLNLLLEVGNTNVLLRYSTNFSGFKYKDLSVINFWKKFKRINLYASLDDSGIRAEFQRKGQKWNEVLANRQLLKEECPHVNFSISPTVSLFNIFHLTTFHRELVETGFIKIGDLIPSLLEEPYEYNIRALPESKKQEVKVIVEAHMVWLEEQPSDNLPLKKFVKAEYGHLIKFMFSENLQSHLPNFKTTNLKLDEFRNESLDEVIPELSNL